MLQSLSRKVIFARDMKISDPLADTVGLAKPLLRMQLLQQKRVFGGLISYKEVLRGDFAETALLHSYRSSSSIM